MISLGLNNEIINAAKIYSGALINNPLELLACLPRYVELLTIVKSSREVINQLKMSITVVLSAKDELVSPKSQRYVAHNENVKTVLLDNSYHYYYAEEDQDSINTGLADFIHKVKDITE